MKDTYLSLSCFLTQNLEAFVLKSGTEQDDIITTIP